MSEILIAVCSSSALASIVGAYFGHKAKISDAAQAAHAAIREILQDERKSLQDERKALQDERERHTSCLARVELLEIELGVMREKYATLEKRVAGLLGTS
jgi:hypothetical protein